nr:hypothetical protein [Tanacetum cinerariifolium]
MLRVFLITLTGAAKSPLSKTTNWLEEICNFKKEGTMNRQLLDSHRPTPYMTLVQALTAIQTMAEHSQKWHDWSSSRKVSSNYNSKGIAVIMNKLDSLGIYMKMLKENVHAIQVGCQTCKGAHLDKECPLNKEVKSVEEVKYGESRCSFLTNGGNSAKYHVGPPGYYTCVDNRPSFSKKRPSLEELMTTNLGGSINIMPNSMFKHLKLPNLKKTDMLIKMADMTKKSPTGIVEKILVKINKFLFPSDFIIIDILGEPNETIILSRPFLAIIHAKINAFNKEISLGIGEDKIMFNMDGNTHHSKILIDKVYMAKYISSEESFNLLEIGDYLFSYESPVCLRFEQYAQLCDNNVDTLGSFDNLQELEVEHREVAKILDSRRITSRWHANTGCSSNGCAFVIMRDEVLRGIIWNFQVSFRVDGYKKIFDNEIEQLANEYDLRIGKKGYVLDDVWEKCEQIHGGTMYSWHDKGFKEEEQWESGIEKTDYDPPRVSVETFEVKSKGMEFEVTVARKYVVK